MVDAKYVNMNKINVGYDGERLIDLSGIDIGFSMDEFQKILDERKQTLRALWLARARCAKAESNVCDLHNEYDEKHLWELVERKCMAKANEYK